MYKIDYYNKRISKNILTLRPNAKDPNLLRHFRLRQQIRLKIDKKPAALMPHHPALSPPLISPPPINPL